MKPFIISLVLVIQFFAWNITPAFAVTAYPHPVEYVLPDGSKITIQLKGDEKIRWAETLDGYSILMNAEGFYEYALLDSNGDMQRSGIRVSPAENRSQAERDLLSKTNKGLGYSQGQIDLMKQIWNIKRDEAQKNFPTNGNRKLICVLIGFTDLAFSKTQSEFTDLFNQVGYTTGGATGSVKDYYIENSYNQLNLTVDVAGPYIAGNNMAYYGANDTYNNDVRPRELAAEAIHLADAAVDYTNYDNDGDGWVDGVYIIYAGYGEEAGASSNAIWAHAWSLATPLLKDGVSINRYSCSPELRSNGGTTITAIGVICHEFGHVLGAPDYYDTDYSTGGQYQGTGYWDMMASGSWNNDGVTPAHHNGYTKVYYYHWADAITLSTDQNITLYNASQNANSFYRYNTATTDEFFLLENREMHLFDSYIPGSGMLIYHVHSGINAVGNAINATHPQRMYPVSQNATSDPSSTSSSYGTINSASCAWTGTEKTTFTDATLPSSKSWAGANTNKPITNISRNAGAKTVAFDFMGGGSGVPTITVTPESLTESLAPNATSMQTVTVSNTGTAPLTFELAVNTTQKTIAENTPEDYARLYERMQTDGITVSILSMDNTRPGGASPDQAKDATLRYDSGINIEGIGLTSGGTFQVASYFPAATMGQYAGMKLSQMEIYINDLPVPCVLKVYGQGTSSSPGALLHEQTVTPVGLSWNTFILTNEVDITGQDLWIGYQVTHTAGLYPAGRDAGPHVTNGDWISTDGVAWNELHVLAPTLDANWNIAGILIDGIVNTNDVSVQTILTPVSAPNLTHGTVSVRVKNNGTTSQSNIPVSYTLDGGDPVTGTLAGSLAAGETFDYTFAGTVDLSTVGQTYLFNVCTALVGDENAANDCKTANVTNIAPAYCDASTTTEDEYIANVLFGTINNTSGWQAGVADYTAQFTSIESGASEAMTITNPAPYATDKVTVWVDWNGDYTYGVGTSEEYILTNVGGLGSSFTGDIMVPAGTPEGDYRMRIRLTYSTAPAPCGNSSYGEIEEYTIQVGAGAPIDPWLTATPLTGTVAAGETINIDVSFNANGLAMGTYNGSLAISSNDLVTPAVTVPIALVVQGVPIQLTVLPSFINKNALAGTVTFIVNSNTSWTVSTNETWISLDQTSGNLNGSFSVQYTANETNALRHGEIIISEDVGTTSKAVFINQACPSQWVQTNGPEGGTVRCLISNGTDMYAVIAGVYHSTDNGQSWSAVNTGLTNDLGVADITSLAIIGSSIFAGAWQSEGIYISTNKGQTWSPANTGLTTHYITSLAVSGTSIFAGTYDGGIFRSTDNGQNWSAVNTGLPNSIFNPQQITYIEALAVNGANIFAGTYDGGIFLSTNNGLSWSAVNNGLPSPAINTIAAIKTIAVSGNNILAGTWGYGVFLSTNNGQSWSVANNGLTSLGMNTLTSDGDKIYAGATTMYDYQGGEYFGGVFCSANNGQTWTPVGTQLIGYAVYSLIINGEDVFAGTENGGIFQLNNNDQSWSSINSGILHGSATTFTSFGSNIFIGTAAGGIFCSGNNGESWSAKNIGLTNGNVRSLSVKEGNIFAGTNGGGIFISSNGGQNWAPANTGLTNKFVQKMAVNGNNIFAETYNWMTTEGGMFRSIDNGQSWSAINTGLTNVNFTSLALRGDTVFAGTYGGGIFRSTNNGESWMEVNTGLIDNFIFSLAFKGNFVFAGTNKGIFRSGNYGQSWSAVGSYNYGIYSLAVADNNIFASPMVGGMVFLSQNNGESWTNVNAGIRDINGVGPFAIYNDTIYAGTAHDGVWKRPLSDMDFDPILRQQDSLALVALYNSTNGPGWTRKENWLISPLENWQGVTFEEGRVVVLNLGNASTPSAGLVGTIPPEFSNLTALRELSMERNQLSGSLPEDWSAFANLQILSLGQNQFSGPLPPSWSSLVNLHFMDLGVNQLSGPLPPVWSSLVNLQTLSLGNNQLTGTLPESWAACANLRALYLRNNQLSGNLPDSWSFLTNLQDLNLSGNQLTGTIPVSWTTFDKILSIELAYNQLSGMLPESWSEFSNLFRLSLKFNQFTGGLPQSWLMLANLRYLEINDNEISGLPDLTPLNKLENLWVHNNLLDFEDIEPNIGLPDNEFIYSPQAAIGIADTVIKSEGQEFRTFVSVGGSNNQYQWYKEGIPISNATDWEYVKPSVGFEDAGIYTCQITNTVATDLVLISQPITLNLLPAAPGTISGAATVCQGQNVLTYTVPEIANATSYLWTLPIGATGSSTTNSISVIFGEQAVSGDISVKGINDSGEGASSNLFVQVNAIPTQPSPISGNSNPNIGSNYVYTVENIEGVNYEWTITGGSTIIDGQGTNAIIVVIGSNDGTITVTPSNACGTGMPSSLEIQVECSNSWAPLPNLQYNLQLVAQILINGQVSLNPNDVLGAFVGNECRGIASPQPDNNSLVFLTVSSNVASGEQVELKIWNSNICSECNAITGFEFINESQIGTFLEPYEVSCGAAQSLSFGQGFTWFSLNVNPGSMSPNNLFTALTPCYDDRVIGQTSFALYTGSSWIGSLTNLGLDKMYRMKLCSAQNLSLMGEAAALNPINLAAGFTWLGYQPQECQSVSAAMAGLSPGPSYNDRVIGQSSFALYTGTAWMGSLTQLCPGKGYIVKLANAQSLTYPAGTSKGSPVVEAETISPTGVYPVENMQHTMMVMAQLRLPDGSISLNEKDVVYAMIDGEVRAIGHPMVGADGIIFLSIAENTEHLKPITFMVWLDEQQKLLPLNETLSFEPLAAIGELNNPFILTLGEMVGVDELTDGIWIGEPYPNPFEDQTTISYFLNEAAELSLSIFDSRGVQVRPAQSIATDKGHHQFSIESVGLARGVYVLEVSIESINGLGNKRIKLIVQ